MPIVELNRHKETPASLVRKIELHTDDIVELVIVAKFKDGHYEASASCPADDDWFRQASVALGVLNTYSQRSFVETGERIISGREPE